MQVSDRGRDECNAVFRSAEAFRTRMPLSCGCTLPPQSNPALQIHVSVAVLGKQRPSAIKYCYLQTGASIDTAVTAAASNPSSELNIRELGNLPDSNRNTYLHSRQVLVVGTAEEKLNSEKKSQAKGWRSF